MHERFIDQFALWVNLIRVDYTTKFIGVVYGLVLIVSGK